MDKKTINLIKNKIEEFEFIHNSMGRLDGASVEAKNLRIRGKKVIADIYLIFERHEEKHPDIEYDIEKLEIK